MTEKVNRSLHYTNREIQPEDRREDINVPQYRKDIDKLKRAQQRSTKILSGLEQVEVCKMG